MEIPVYVLTGFIESGKTSFMMETIEDEDFSKGEKTLLIVCEEGIEEYDPAVLKDYHTDIVMVEEELTEEFLLKLKKKYAPSRVLIEYNGMWKMDALLNLKFPKNWVIIQIITLVDASTFEVYMNNMRSVLAEQFGRSDMIIFNRCDENTNVSFCRRNIKALNKRAQIYFERADGSQPEMEEEDLPFDINAPVIVVEDDDYGIWYLDILDHLDHYVGKKIQFKGMVYRSKQFPKNCFVPGRFAMTCCADDTTFIGFLCNYQKTSLLQNQQWILVTARVEKEYQEQYHEEGPVLYAEEVVLTEGPDERLVYFN